MMRFFYHLSNLLISMGLLQPPRDPDEPMTRRERDAFDQGVSLGHNAALSLVHEELTEALRDLGDETALRGKVTTLAARYFTYASPHDRRHRGLRDRLQKRLDRRDRDRERLAPFTP